MIDIKQNQITILAGVSMMKILLLLFAFLFCGAAMAQEKTVNMRDDVLSSINGDTIGKIEIMHIPYIVTTNRSILPDQMETNYHCKLSIRNYSLYLYLHSLIDALKETDINRLKIDSASRWEILPSYIVSEVRWGIILYDADDRRIVSIYVDRGYINSVGTRGGYINSTPVTFNSGASKGLAWWLESNFLEALGL